MSDKLNRPENEDVWEMRVQQAAQQFIYPPTPDIAVNLRRPSRSDGSRRVLQLGAVFILIAVVSMVAIPEMRASVLGFLRIGAIRILQIEPTATWVNETRSSILNLPNETTLERAEVSFRIPTYPPALPDRVFVQKGDFEMVSLVWLKDDDVWFSLHVLTENGFVEKGQVRNMQETEINGQWAVWLTEPHPIIFRLNEDRELAWQVQGHVLIWEDDGLTYRLEGDLTLDEARQIAESLE